ncbi:MAG: 50S ribosomal protein L33 [Rhodospirillales bacterium]|nr:50S ribosomal protein L33 [Alphaproteobacteria bacterium]USO03760.1 MAG: 50S ribosomal protein L33 [Rhodospirillales bacterium]
MAKKGGAVKVRMESSAGTGFRYYKKKGAKYAEKLKMRKFDPWAVNPETGKKGMHVEFVEKKMPPSKAN